MSNQINIENPFKISNVSNIYPYPIARIVHIPLTKDILQYEYTSWIGSTLPVFFCSTFIVRALF